MEITQSADAVPEYKPAPVPKLLSLPLPEMAMCAPKKKPNLEYHPEKPALNASPAKKRYDEVASAPKYVPSAVVGTNGASGDWPEHDKEEVEEDLDELAEANTEVKLEQQVSSEEAPNSDSEQKPSSSARSESRKHDHKTSKERDKEKERRSSSHKDKERSERRSSSSSSKHKSSTSSSASSSHRKSTSSDRHRSEKSSGSKDRSSTSKSTTSSSSSSRSRQHSSSSSKSTSRSSGSSKSKSSSSSSSSRSKDKAETESTTTTETATPTAVPTKVAAKPAEDFVMDEMDFDASDAEIVRQCEMIFDELEQEFAQLHKPEETSAETMRKRKAPSPDIDAYTEAATAALQKRRVAHENADKCKPQAPIAVHKPNHIRNAMQAIFDRRAELRRQERLRAEADAEQLRQAQERVRVAQEELREARAKTLTPLISRSALTPPTRTGGSTTPNLLKVPLQRVC